MHRDDLKPLLWSAAGGAVAAVIVGFALAGWKTAGSADALAQQAAAEAVTERLAPICAALAERDPEQKTKLTALTDTSSWQRGDVLAGFGWATMPGERDPDAEVADACALLILPRQ
jgi:hypothetical protein